MRVSRGDEEYVIQALGPGHAPFAQRTQADAGLDDPGTGRNGGWRSRTPRLNPIPTPAPLYP